MGALINMLETLLFYDKQVFYYINKGLANNILDFMIPLINNEKNWIVPAVIIIVAVLVWGGHKARMVLLAIFITVLATDLICFRLLKPVVGRKRPSHALEDARVVGGKRGTMGFPSNHAANVAAAVTVLAYYYRRLIIPGITLSAVVAFGRVYVGVHYPLDVICGAAIGVFIGLVLIWLKNKVILGPGQVAGG